MKNGMRARQYDHYFRVTSFLLLTLREEQFADSAVYRCQIAQRLSVGGIYRNQKLEQRQALTVEGQGPRLSMVQLEGPAGEDPMSALLSR